MRDSIFIKKFASDLEVVGIQLDTKKADSSIELLTMVATSLGMIISDEVMDVAYTYYSIGPEVLNKVYVLNKENIPDYMSAVEPIVVNDELYFKGFELIANAIRYRKSYLGEDKLQEEFNVCLIFAMLTSDYFKEDNIIRPFSEDVSVVVSIIKLADLLAERITNG